MIRNRPGAKMDENGASAPQSAPTMPVQTLDSLREQAFSLYRLHGSWRRVAALWGVSVGTLVRVAGGYEPKRAGIRAALGLPPLGIVQMARGITTSSGALVLRSSRKCSCGCQSVFIPGHPQQLYLSGHRKHRRSKGANHNGRN
jgi:hypothetical protein